MSRPGFRHKHPIVFYGILFGLLCVVIGAFIATSYVKNVLETTPEVNEQMLISQGTSNMYASDGTLIWSDTDVRRDYIESEDIPDLYKDMLLSVEDRGFYEHDGFSYTGLGNAGIGYFKELFLGGEPARGGSTIEQQLIKNVAFQNNASITDRSVDRKIKELFLSTQLNQNFEKDQILEWYINKIEMGENSLGANTIAMTYYGQPLSEFKDYTPENIAKMAYIAGIPKSPGEYNLYDNPELSEQRRNDVLFSAKENGVITQAQFDAALEVPIDQDLKERHWRNNEVLEQTTKYSAFVDAALKEVEQLGYDLEQTPIEIHTTLDRETNDWLQNEVDKPDYVQTEEQQYGVTVIDNQSRQVVAMVGGRHNSDPYAYNRALQTSRSSGSVIKPFIDYAPVFEYLGYGTDYKVNADNYVYPGTNLVARNYGLFEYGNVTMKESLIQSFNTSSIRLLDEHIGSDNAKQFLSNVGLDVKDYYGAGDALGLNVSTYDLANAFSTFANQGIYQKSKTLDKLIFSDGSERQVSYDSSIAMRPSTAYITLQILNEVTKENEFAESADVKNYKGYATKTGSVAYDDQFFIENNLPDFAHSDGWIGGTTKNYAVTLWTGYDKPLEPNHFLYEEQNDQRQGLYANIMRHLNQDLDTGNFEQPKGVNTYKVGKDTHYQPTDLNDTYYDYPTAPERTNGDTEGAISDRQQGDEIKVKDSKETPYEIPEDYEPESWKKDVDEENQSLLEDWLNGDRDVPSEDDLPSDVYR